MNTNTIPLNHVRAIIGLGNPGRQYYYNRHNIGFRVVDALAQRYQASFKSEGECEYATIMMNNEKVLLVKPQTFMNSSGKVIPFLAKKGIKANELLVVHDELELPFGKIALKDGGSAKGHNGLKSIIAAAGDQFLRLRIGIGRPVNRDAVPEYVLQNFSEPESEIQNIIDQAVTMIEQAFSS